MSKIRTPAQIAGRQRRAERQSEQRATAVAAVSASREAGKRAGMDAVTAMHEALAVMRAETAGDPAAAAVATTWLLHGLVGAGPRSDSDSLAAAGMAERAAAVRMLRDTGLDHVAIGKLLNLDASRVGAIAGPRKPKRAKALADTVVQVPGQMAISDAA